MTFADTPISTGSQALNTSLVAGGLLRNGIVSMSGSCDLMMPFIRSSAFSAKSSGKQSLVLTVGSESTHLNLKKLLLAQPQHQGIVLLSCLSYTECIDAIQSFIMFGAVELLVIYDLNNDDSLDLSALLEMIKGQNLATLLLSASKPESESIYASVELAKKDVIPDQNGGVFGWRIHGKVSIKQYQDFEESTQVFSTVYTSSYDIYKPYDLAISALILGIFERSSTGEIKANGKPFSANLSGAIERLNHLVPMARLENAVQVRTPFLRLK
jgi:hypothetical protein